MRLVQQDDDGDTGDVTRLPDREPRLRAIERVQKLVAEIQADERKRFGPDAPGAVINTTIIAAMGVAVGTICARDGKHPPTTLAAAVELFAAEAANVVKGGGG